MQKKNWRVRKRRKSDRKEKIKNKIRAKTLSHLPFLLSL